MRRLVAVALAAGVVALGAWAFWFAGTDTPRHADAIVVLAGDPHRIATGIDLFNERVAPRLLVSLYDEVPSALCTTRGVTCFHAHPFSTQGEARTTARIARRRGLHSIVIVTSRYHLRRARMLFARCTDARLQTVRAPASLVGYVKGTALEVGKWAYQLTLDRSC